MNIIEIIEKKKNKKTLSKKEICYFVNGYVSGEIKDYQASSLLMAICINGMNEKETFALCDAMINSGEKLDLSFIKGIKVDKHSSGGVSDTTSISLIPILSCAGLICAKMSGNGLGFTGGTIDKLESFSGINLERNEQEVKDIINKCGCLIIKQSKELVPADKKLYALRDISGTIDSIPLIATSIMSKKIASGNDIIFLDVKVDDGAFMKNLKDAKKLANLMVKIGTHYKKKVAVVISQMDEPLGNGIGCYYEILDSVDILKGTYDKNGMLYKLIKFMATNIMKLSGKYNEKDAENKFNEVIESGMAYNKFTEMIQLLGGNINDISKMNDCLSHPSQIFTAQNKCYIKDIKCRKLGYLVNEMGGGRNTIEDTVCHSVGIKLHKHIGDKVDVGETIAEIFNTNKKLSDDEIYARLKDCIVLTDKPTEKTKLIKYFTTN